MKLTGYITKNFRWSEARCKNGEDVPKRLYGNAARIALMAQAVRDKATARAGHDCPMVILSWYRPDAYNVACGGAPGSRHRDAAAIDGRIPAFGDQFACHALIEEMVAAGELPKNIGLGLYTRENGWFHLDFRGTPARWTSRGFEDVPEECEPDEVADVGEVG